MKTPDRKESCLLAVLLLALGAAGCSGVNTTVPISPMMFMKNTSPQPGQADSAHHALAVNDNHPVIARQ